MAITFAESLGSCFSCPPPPLGKLEVRNEVSSIAKLCQHHCKMNCKLCLQLGEE